MKEREIEKQSKGVRKKKRGKTEERTRERLEDGERDLSYFCIISTTSSQSLISEDPVDQ